MSSQQIPLFGQRRTLEEAMELTVDSLRMYGAGRHWAVAYSGGKDSSATVSVVAWLIAQGRVPQPKSLTVLYADTRMELPPLQMGAQQMLAELTRRGVNTQVVLPSVDERFFVYMLGRGVPPPNNRTLRWCTPQIKVEPMLAALENLHAAVGEKFLMLTGVRLGESAVRDQRITLSCSRDGAECGQGWFQETTPSGIADTLAPLLHWRVCQVWEWLMFHAPAQGFPTQLVAEVYGGDEAQEINARTGCVGCPLAENDAALDYVLSLPQWGYLKPLKRLRPLYRELRQFRNRLQKYGERNADGRLSKHPNRKGPLTMEARGYGLRTVLAIQNDINAVAREQGRPEIDFLNADEAARIKMLVAENTWPRKWTGDEARGDVLLPLIHSNGSVQEILFGREGW